MIILTLSLAIILAKTRPPIKDLITHCPQIVTKRIPKGVNSSAEGQQRQTKSNPKPSNTCYVLQLQVQPVLRRAGRAGPLPRHGQPVPQLPGVRAAHNAAKPGAGPRGGARRARPGRPQARQGLPRRRQAALQADHRRALVKSPDAGSLRFV